MRLDLILTCAHILFAVVVVHELPFEVLYVFFYHLPAISEVRMMRVSMGADLLAFLNKA